MIDIVFAVLFLIFCGACLYLSNEKLEFIGKMCNVGLIIIFLYSAKMAKTPQEAMVLCTISLFILIGGHMDELKEEIKNERTRSQRRG